MPKNKSIKSMTDEELRKFYGLDNDLTEEEKERLQKQAALLSIDITLKLVKNMTEETLQAFEQIRGELQNAFTPETVRKLSDLLEEVRNREEALPDGALDPDEQPLPEELPEASDGQNVPALILLGKAMNIFHYPADEQRAELEIATTKDGNGGYVVVMDWDEIEKRNPEIKKLTPFDRRIHDALCSFWAAGEPIASMQALCRWDGTKGNAGKRDIQNLQKSLDRLNIRISMDYVASFKDRHGNTKNIQIVDRGAVVSTRTITATIKGRKTKGAVKILDEPPLLKEAQRTGQLTILPRKLLQVEGNRTEESLIIHDCLLRYVVRLKHDPSLSEKIKLNTVCKWTGLDPDDKSPTARNAKSRIKSRVIKTLEKFKRESFIQDYEVSKGMVFIDAGKKKRLKRSRKMDYKK